jgi:hypothetical protein
MLAIPQYNKGVSVTKSDTVDEPNGMFDAIYVGGAGVVVVVFQDGSTASFTCVAGQILPIRAKRINNTNTTATLMIALYEI